MKNSFDDAAAHWDDNPLHRERVEAVARAILDSVPLEPGMRGVEVGCGTGQLGFTLLPQLDHLSFTDNSPAMLERVAEKGREFPGKVSTLKLDISRDELPEKYALILALMTFHHMPGIEENVARMITHLLPGGYFCLADLVEDDGHFHRHGDHKTVYNGFNPAYIAELFTAGGLQVLASTIPYRNRDPERSFRIFLVTGQLPA